MTSQALELSLPFTPPFDWPALLGFLAARAISGVEAIEGGIYRRTVQFGTASGTLEVCPDAGRADTLSARLRLTGATSLAPTVARLRRVFDLDANPAAIAAHLALDPMLSPSVAARPGLRLPGAWDPFELAVRAILGQQVSVRAATTLAGRLAARHGDRLASAEALPGLIHLFPRPDVLAQADLRSIGLPGARAAAISALAAAIVADPALLDPRGELEAMAQRLATLPGIGPWTAQYIAMRALREPDAFPSSDLGLLRAAAGANGVRPTPAALLVRAEAWRPWRAYAAMHLWAADSAALSPAQGMLA